MHPPPRQKCKNSPEAELCPPLGAPPRASIHKTGSWAASPDMAGQERPFEIRNTLQNRRLSRRWSSDSSGRGERRHGKATVGFTDCCSADSYHPRLLLKATSPGLCHHCLRHSFLVLPLRTIQLRFSYL